MDKRSWCMNEVRRFHLCCVPRCVWLLICCRLFCDGRMGEGFCWGK